MIKIREKWLSLAILAIFAAPLVVQAAVFDDVPPSHPFYDPIQSMYDKNVTKGYSDGTFRPDQLVTRAELMKMVFTHIGYKPTENTGETKYQDVPKDAWFAPFVKKGVDIGILGYGEEMKFFPETQVTKIDALKVIMPLEGIPTPLIDNETILRFTDVREESSYSYLAKAAQNAGLIDTSINRFDPYKLLTRGELSYLLYRAEIYRQVFGLTSFPTEIPYYSNSELTAGEEALLNNPKFPIFIDVWSRINQAYIDKNDLDQNELIYMATQGMVNSLGDQYSIFESPEKGMEIEDSFEGSYEGIGVVIDEFENQPIILSVIKDSPAEKAGLKAGDILLKIDQKSLEGLSTDEISRLIKGDAGTKITLEIKRNLETFTFTIIREELTLDSVVIQEEQQQVVIPENIGYLSIYQFTESTGDEFDTLLKSTLDKNPKGLILDLRNNPGGYLTTAYQVMDHFIPKDDVLINIEISDRLSAEYSDGEGEILAKNIPVVVLINKGTASASEVVAGALQDYKIAKLIGETSFGKGTVQEVTNYTDGSFFKLSIAHWLTPKKRDINKVGLTPDITVVETKDDALGKTDSQLEKAIQELQKMMQ
ncbi:S-layer homology domain-containing protein [Candidatus Peregrinibacteria bacterium]|nr:S-layer homology domain-containing protein [Candidatus Peregrinibacteria bacterium]